MGRFFTRRKTGRSVTVTATCALGGDASEFSKRFTASCSLAFGRQGFSNLGAQISLSVVEKANGRWALGARAQANGVVQSASIDLADNPDTSGTGTLSVQCEEYVEYWDESPNNDPYFNNRVFASRMSGGAIRYLLVAPKGAIVSASVATDDIGASASAVMTADADFVRLAEPTSFSDQNYYFFNYGMFSCSAAAESNHGAVGTAFASIVPKSGDFTLPWLSWGGVSKDVTDLLGRRIVSTVSAGSVSVTADSVPSDEINIGVQGSFQGVPSIGLILDVVSRNLEGSWNPGAYTISVVDILGIRPGNLSVYNQLVTVPTNGILRQGLPSMGYLSGNADGLVSTIDNHSCLRASPLSTPYSGVYRLACEMPQQVGYLSGIQEIKIDDGEATRASWSNLRNTTILPGDGDSVAILSSSADSVAYRAWNPPQMIYTHRFLRIRVRSKVNDEIDFKVAWGKTDVGYERYWNFKTGNAGEWVDIDLDIMFPHTIPAASRFGRSAYRKYPANLSPNREELRAWGGPVFLGYRVGTPFDSLQAPLTFDSAEYRQNPLYFAGIPKGETLEVRSITLIRRIQSRVTATPAWRYFEGYTDGKPSLQVWDIDRINTSFGFTTQRRTIAEFWSSLNTGHANNWASGTIMPLTRPLLQPTSDSRWIGGGIGAVWDGTQWINQINLDARGQANIYAQAAGTALLVYPGCPDYTRPNSPVDGTQTLRLLVQAGYRFEGAVQDLDREPLEGVNITQIDPFGRENSRNETDLAGRYQVVAPGGNAGNSSAGSAVFVEEDPINTRAPGKGGDEYSLAQPISHINFRAEPADPIEKNPWNLEERWGQYHRVATIEDDVYYWWSQNSVPKPFQLVRQRITQDGRNVDPRMGKDPRGRVYLSYAKEREEVGPQGEALFDVWWSNSDDDGESFNEEEIVIPNGRHPTICCGRDGTMIIAGFIPNSGAENSPGKIKAVFQEPGERDVSAIFTFKDEDNADLTVEDDTFHVQLAWDQAARHILAVRIQGESKISEWASYDQCRTWRRVTGTGT